MRPNFGPGLLLRVQKALQSLLINDYRRSMMRGVVAGLEHAGVLSNLHCKTIIDIGANKGQFALVALHTSPGVRVVSFEPLPAPAKRYRRILGKQSQVTLHELAIGPTQGSVRMHVSRREDSSSLLPIGPKQSVVFPGTQEIGDVAVSVVRLDQCLNVRDVHSPSLLKIDVQGYELQALRGCESLMEAFDFIYVECSFVELYSGQALADEIVDWLSTRNFVLKGIYNPTYYEGLAIQGDFLFEKRNATSLLARLQGRDHDL
jgi:FkbM family methyltransferase